MKLLKLFAAALTASTIAGTAFAADLPSRKEAPIYVAPPIMTWNGFYVGINVGGTFGGNNGVAISTAPTFANPALTPFGVSEFNNVTVGGNGVLPGGNNGAFIGGGQIGYNWQFATWLLGLEADIQGIAGQNGSQANTASILPTTAAGVNSLSILGGSKRLDYLGTVRGRLGYLATPTFLLYATGGLAYGGAKASASIFQQADVPLVDNGPTFSAGAFSNTRVGWTAGAGLEWMFAPNWSVKAEYLYYDLGRATFGAGARVATIVGGAPVIWSHVSSATTRFNGHVVRAGVNYHFNWGAAPVVARY